MISGRISATMPATIPEGGYIYTRKQTLFIEVEKKKSAGALFEKYTLLTAERIWFKCDLYLRFIPPINIWNIWIDLRPFLKCKEGPFSRSWRSPRSNNLEIQNDENSK